MNAIYLPGRGDATPPSYFHADGGWEPCDECHGEAPDSCPMCAGAGGLLDGEPMTLAEYQSQESTYE